MVSHTCNISKRSGNTGTECADGTAPHPLVQWGDCLDGGVPWVDVHSLLRVGVEVEQSGYEVLNEAQRLSSHIPSLQLKPSRASVAKKNSQSRALTAMAALLTYQGYQIIIIFDNNNLI